MALIWNLFRYNLLSKTWIIEAHVNRIYNCLSIEPNLCGASQLTILPSLTTSIFANSINVGEMNLSDYRSTGRRLNDDKKSSECDDNEPLAAKQSRVGNLFLTCMLMSLSTSAWDNTMYLQLTFFFPETIIVYKSNLIPQGTNWLYSPIEWTNINWPSFWL